MATFAKGQINRLGSAGHVVCVTTKHRAFSKHTVNKRMDEAALHEVQADVEHQLDPATLHTPQQRSGEGRAQTSGTQALFSDAETPCCLWGWLEPIERRCTIRIAHYLII